jgi:type IV pilus assembly protein PilA
MLQFLVSRLRDSQTSRLDGEGAAEAGFTLIELMVVLLIIAILLAIAIPTFLGVTSSANDRAAQSNLTNGLTEAESQFQSAGQSYSGISAALSSSAPEFTWSSSNCTTSATNCISIDPVDVVTSTDNAGVVMAAMSKTGTCWWIAQLQGTPATIASSGFIQAAAAHAGAQQVGGSNIASAGTYYAKKTTAGANCSATYIETPAAGFNWGSSFGTAGTN